MQAKYWKCQNKVYIYNIIMTTGFKQVKIPCLERF